MYILFLLWNQNSSKHTCSAKAQTPSVSARCLKLRHLLLTMKCFDNRTSQLNIPCASLCCESARIRDICPFQCTIPAQRCVFLNIWCMDAVLRCNEIWMDSMVGLVTCAYFWSKCSYQTLIVSGCDWSVLYSGTTKCERISMCNNVSQ